MTRQQQWATAAQKAVREMKEGEHKAKHKTFGMKMPGLIQQSGLVQALVFVKSRAEGDVFINKLAAVHGSGNSQKLIAEAQTSSLSAYLALSRDLIEVSTWVRRFIQIEMKDVKEE